MARNESEHDFVMKNFSKLPIICDLLLLPEQNGVQTASLEFSFDSSFSSLSHHEYLHVPKNKMNPCGITNVLILEDLPEAWITGTVLLSLTSCGFSKFKRNKDEESINSISLSIEPVLSAFVLDFSNDEDIYRSTASEKSRISLKNSFASVKLISEISVEFDIQEATRQTGKRHFEKQDSMKAIVAKDKEQRLQDDTTDSNHDRLDKNNISLFRGEHAKEKREGYCFCNDCRPRLDILSCYSIFTTKDFIKYKLMLVQIDARLKQDTRTMDLILSICSFSCFFLIAQLFWTVYHNYRPIIKPKLFYQAIRFSIRKNRDILIMVFNELNDDNYYILYEGNYLNSFEKNKFEGESQEPQAICEPLIDKTDRRDRYFDFFLTCQWKTKVEDKILNVMTRTLHSNDAHTYKQDSFAQARGVEIDEKSKLEKSRALVRLSQEPSSLNRGAEVKLVFLRYLNVFRDLSPTPQAQKAPIENFHLLNSAKGLVNEIILDNSKKMLAKSKHYREQSISSGKTTISASLSRYLQSAKEWNGGKLNRNQSLKRPRQYLKPFLRSNIKYLSSSSNFPYNEDIGNNLFKSTMLSFAPKTSDIQHVYIEQRTLECSFLPPTKFRSIISKRSLMDDVYIESLSVDKSAKDSLETNTKKNDLINGMKTPPRMMKMKSSHLYNFPEDNSFVEDYW